MNDEIRQDRAIEYVFGWMDAAKRRAFEAELKADDELARTVAEFRDSAGALAHAVPLHLPPAQLRGNVLAMNRSDSAPTVAPAPIPAGTPAPAPPPSPRRNWLPWATTGVLAFCCALLAADRMRLSTNLVGWRKLTEQWQTEAATRLKEATEASEAARMLDDRAAALQKQSTALATEVAQLKSQDSLAQIATSTLTAQTGPLAKARIVVVWDDQKQRGLITLTNLPRAETGKDYQLWAMDARFPNPLSGGVLPIGEDGSARIGFQIDQPVGPGAKFVISVEPAGGSATLTGPTVLAAE